MKVIAVIERPAIIRQILEHLGLHRSAQLSRAARPARWPGG
jgi:ribosomal protein L30/L7E